MIADILAIDTSILPMLLPTSWKTSLKPANRLLWQETGDCKRRELPQGCKDGLGILFPDAGRLSDRPSENNPRLPS